MSFTEQKGEPQYRRPSIPVLTNSSEMKEPELQPNPSATLEPVLQPYPSAPLEPLQDAISHTYLGHPQEGPGYPYSMYPPKYQDYPISNTSPQYQSTPMYPSLSACHFSSAYQPVQGNPQCYPLAQDTPTIQIWNVQLSPRCSQSEPQTRLKENAQNNQPKNILTKVTSVPTSRPAVIAANPFNPREDAAILKTAINGFGINEKRIIQLLTRCTNKQRLLIISEFKTLYRRDLVWELKGKTSGKFRDLLVALMTPLPKFYARELHCMDEDVFIEVISTMSNGEIKVIEQAYTEMYEELLLDDLAYFGLKQIMALKQSLSMSRSSGAFTADKEKAKEFSSSLLLTAVQGVNNKPLFFAERFHKAMKGKSFNNRQLIRIMVTRCEIDMQDIAEVFKEKYGKALDVWIKDTCRGYYKKCLLGLLGHY